MKRWVELTQDLVSFKNDTGPFWRWIEDRVSKMSEFGYPDDSTCFFFKWCVKNTVDNACFDALFSKINKAKPGPMKSAVLSSFQTSISMFMAESESKDEPLHRRRIKGQSIATVRRHFRGDNENADDDVSDVLAVHTFEVEPARVDLTMSLTLNLGNFESATIRRGLSIPCYREEIEVVAKNIDEWITTRIRNDRRKIKGGKDLIDEPGIGLTGHDQEEYGDEDDTSLLPGD